MLSRTQRSQENRQQEPEMLRVWHHTSNDWVVPYLDAGDGHNLCLFDHETLQKGTRIKGMYIFVLASLRRLCFRVRPSAVIGVCVIQTGAEDWRRGVADCHAL